LEEKGQLNTLYQLYLKNRCTAEELEQFFTLLRKKKDAEILSLMSATWDQTDATPESGLYPDFLKQAKQVKLNPEHVSRFRVYKAIAIAAMLMIISGIYFYRSDLGSLFQTNGNYEHASTSNKRKQFQLPDGTRVWLSPNSKLDYPAKFEGSERRVSLTGEAFFEVTHDAKHPFTIKSGQLSTTVLGTSFNVTAYTQQHTINVTLVTGKVALALAGQNNTQRDTIVANQRVIVDQTTFRIIKEDFPNAAAFLNKRLGLYEYGGAALQEVVTDLSNQYNIKIKLDNGISEKHFYGNLNMTDPIEQSLNKLCTVMEMKWEKQGGLYVILK
jgi:transmembrane sensor